MYDKISQGTTIPRETLVRAMRKNKWLFDEQVKYIMQTEQLKSHNSGDIVVSVGGRDRQTRLIKHDPLAFLTSVIVEMLSDRTLSEN